MNVSFIYAESWISSLLAIGAFLGALPTGYIADAIGRRYTALAMDVPFILAWLSISFANSAGWLYFGRFLIGELLILLILSESTTDPSFIHLSF